MTTLRRFVVALRNRLGYALIALGRVLAGTDRPLVSRPISRPERRP